MYRIMCAVHYNDAGEMDISKREFVVFSVLAHGRLAHTKPVLCKTSPRQHALTRLTVRPKGLKGPLAQVPDQHPCCRNFNSSCNHGAWSSPRYGK